MENIALTEAVYYILLSLDQPLHGYGIMQNIERISGGRVRLAAGTLYGACLLYTSRGGSCVLYYEQWRVWLAGGKRSGKNNSDADALHLSLIHI